MPRSTVLRVHLVASVAAVAIVSSFLIASAAVEVTGDENAVRAVKGWVLRALVLLIPVMAAAGLSGRRLAGRSRAAVVRRKLRRMKTIGATGLLVLVPCAITLERLATQDDFGLAFATVQAVEGFAGTLNLTLLMLNLRDGMNLRSKRTAVARRRRPAALTAATR